MKLSDLSIFLGRLSCIPFLGIVPAILAIVLSFLSWKDSKKAFTLGLAGFGVNLVAILIYAYFRHTAAPTLLILFGAWYFAGLVLGLGAAVVIFILIIAVVLFLIASDFFAMRTMNSQVKDEVKRLERLTGKPGKS